MNKPDKFFEPFQQAANQAEQHRFPGFEQVWQQVETRLDKEANPKGISFSYKRLLAIAASIIAIVWLSVAIFNHSKTTQLPIANSSSHGVAEIPESKTSVPVKELAATTPEKRFIKPTQQQNKVVEGKKIEPGVKESLASTLTDTTAIAAIAATVKGVVMDTAGMPVPYATVHVESTGSTVAADSTGAFSIAAHAGDVVAIRALGYKPAKIQVTNTYPVNIALQPEVAALNEVVVVGYGARMKKSMTGSTTIISGNARKTSRSNSEGNSVQVALQGRVAGVQSSQQSKALTFAANPNPSIQIRGNTSISTTNLPMYVVNGKVVNENAMNNLSTHQIEKIDVLKDAGATALYGSRAQNGVIIITTKKLSAKEQKRLDAFNLNSMNAGIFLTPAGQEEYNPLVENPFTSPQASPLSTFSIDVDNAAYTNIRRMINNGEKVPKDAVRIEEMVNFFKYQYAPPTDSKPFAVHTEYQDAPWNTQHKLLRIALQAKDIAAEQLPASNLVFLIDVSGSMNDANRLPLVKASLKVLVDQLRSRDRVSIVVYAGAAGLVLPPTAGDKKDSIMAAIEKLNAGGSTAGGEGIQLAYKTAAENFVKGGNNRVILATDGDFNVGISSQADLQKLIEEQRKSGIFLTCLGYGMGNYKDNTLELLADKGNGNYAYIDNMQEANRFLGKEFKGALYTVAKDVKLQIEFNPTQVKNYRLIGYENRMLNEEDFVNDKIDAGEMGVGHTVTALYEIIPVGVDSKFAASLPPLKYTVTATIGSNDVATIKLRYKKPDEDKSTEWSVVVPSPASGKSSATEDFRFAAAVAWFGLKLRDSELVPDKQVQHIIQLAKSATGFDPDGYRAEFIRLVEAAK